MAGKGQLHVTGADILYTPQEAYTYGMQYLDHRRNSKDIGVPIGIDSLDLPDENGDHFLPALPGELISIIARPGNGKTGFMMRWARHRAKWLHENGYDKRVVVYATWEQSIEELYAFVLAAEAHESGSEANVTRMAGGHITDQEWQELMKAGAVQLQYSPWFIGHSLARRAARPRIGLDAVAMALQSVERWEDGVNKGFQIDMVFVDYLQRIPFDGRVEGKVIGTSELLDRLKDAALHFGCPVVVGVQARREVDERKVQIPMQEDGQWTSGIEQVSDGSLSLVRPRKYRSDGESFGSMIVKGHTQMLVTVLKRKLGPDNFAKWVYFAPEYNKLDELEVKNVNLQDYEVHR